MSFLHGIKVLEIDQGPRPIQVVKSSVIGLIGTAPQGPVNVPTLIAGSRAQAVKIFGAPDGATTIPDALDAIFDQAGAAVVVLNVLPQVDKPATALTLVNGVAELPDARFIADTLVVTSSDESTTYTAGVDYQLVNHEIHFIAGGALTPTQTIKVVYAYTDPSTFTAAALKGSVDPDTGAYRGVHAFLAAESVVHLTPRILVAPGFTGQVEMGGTPPAPRPVPVNKDIVDELLGVAERLRAVVIADGPNGTDEQAKTFRTSFDSSRLYLVDPHVKVFDPITETEVVAPASARVAGILAKSDAERGFWYSPSNQTILGITGTARPVDFALGDENSSANLLNEKHVATIIHMNGYRLWGNRSCTADTKWMFLSVRRTADMINDSLLRAHMWAVDNNITKNYIESVTLGVNDFLRNLKTQGAILGGRCWADPELNTPDQIQQGKVYFDFDFTPPFPAESITFRSQLVNNYISEVI
ncbi:MAG: phage tail sheath C-terminal domain-containing protein [Bacteroidota bacterium]